MKEMQAGVEKNRVIQHESVKLPGGIFFPVFQMDISISK